MGKITKSKKLPELIKLKQASKLLNVHPNTLRQWDKKGILKAVRFGQRRDRRYRKQDMLNLLNNKSENN